MLYPLDVLMRSKNRSPSALPKLDGFFVILKNLTLKSPVYRVPQLGFKDLHISFERPCNAGCRDY